MTAHVLTFCRDLVDSGSNIQLFSKNQYGLHSDQFPGHPDGVNCIVPVTDNVVMTGCEDGNIRAVHLYPHRFLGVVGHHEQEFPVERLDVNTSGEIIASISHDNRLEARSLYFSLEAVTDLSTEHYSCR